MGLIGSDMRLLDVTCPQPPAEHPLSRISRPARAAFAGAGASSASATCLFRESIPHPVQPLSTLRTPRCRDARKTRSRPACSALDGPDLHWQAHISFSYRTPHPAFRLASPQGTRRRPPDARVEGSARQLSEDMIAGEPVDAAPLRFVPLTEEVSGAVIDVVIDGPYAEAGAP